LTARLYRNSLRVAAYQSRVNACANRRVLRADYSRCVTDVRVPWVVGVVASCRALANALLKGSRSAEGVRRSSIVFAAGASNATAWAFCPCPHRMIPRSASRRGPQSSRGSALAKSVGCRPRNKAMIARGTGRMTASQIVKITSDRLNQLRAEGCAKRSSATMLLPCSSSTWIGSRTSTTAGATKPGMRCWSP
jgi:hypothetical protein